MEQEQNLDKDALTPENPVPDAMKPPQEETAESARTADATGETANASRAEKNDVTGETAENSRTADATGETAEASDEEKAPDLTEEEKLTAKLQEVGQQYLYLQAEYQNYRKRVARDMADARQFAMQDTVLPFLDVADFLRMADVAAGKSDNLEALKQGLQMIINQFNKALSDLGITRMETAGIKFDPKLHEAVRKEPSDTVEEGMILQEWNGGYLLNGKVLRAPRVIVSSGKPQVAAPEEEEK